MADTTGASLGGRSSRFMARTFESNGPQRQSKYGRVGNKLRAAPFESLKSKASPNERLHAGLICRFQKIGNLSIGGLDQSRSTGRGTNKTLPPLASFFSASSHE